MKRPLLDFYKQKLYIVKAGNTGYFTTPPKLFLTLLKGQ